MKKVEMYKTWKVEDPKKKTLAGQNDKIVQLFENDEDMTLEKAKSILKRRNINLSIATTSRRLHEFGFSRKIPLSKPLLWNAHLKKHLEWCNQMAEIDWKQSGFFR